MPPPYGATLRYATPRLLMVAADIDYFDAYARLML